MPLPELVAVVGSLVVPVWALGSVWSVPELVSAAASAHPARA
jgi:hypothetical protein